MVQQKGRTKIDAGRVTLIVQHELWDGNVQDHSDQGVAVLVTGENVGAPRGLLFKPWLRHRSEFLASNIFATYRSLFVTRKSRPRHEDIHAGSVTIFLPSGQRFGIDSHFWG